MPKNSSAAAKAAAGLAALAAAAAATYYFAMDEKAKKHRQQAITWATKAKHDAIKEISKLKTLARPAYDNAIKSALSKYAGYKGLLPGELKSLEKELKSQWKNISGHLKAGKKTKTRAGSKIKKNA